MFYHALPGNGGTTPTEDLEPVLLWTNPNPTAEFTAQTVSLDLTDYAGVFGRAISGFRGNTVGSESAAGNLIYRVHTLNGKWLGEIKDRQQDKSGDDFAGILGRSIDGIAIKATKGIARYRVHIKGGNWLSWVTQYNINDSNKGMAGIYGREIDAIQVEII